MADYTALIGGIDFGGFFESGTTIIWWTSIGLIIVGIIWLIWYIFSFKHTVIIKEKFGQAIAVKIGAEKDQIKQLDKAAFSSLTPDKPGAQLSNLPDVEDEKPGKDEKVIRVYPYIGKIHKAKIKSRKKIKYIQLMFTNIKLMVPDQIYINITRKGKKFIELTKLSDKLYAPTVLIEGNTGEHQYLFNEGWFDWVVNDIERDHTKYMTNDWWSKYGNWVLTAGLLVIMLIIIVVTLRHTQQIVNAAGQIAGSMAEAGKMLAEAQTNQNVG